MTGEFDDKNVYPQLKELLEKVEQRSLHARQLFLLPGHCPAVFLAPIVEQLAAVGLMEENNQHWRRVIIEKPFGHDLDSASA